MRSEKLPSYDELPRLGDLDLRHAWDVWGPQDKVGTLGLLSDSVRLRALGLVKEGRCINLTLPVSMPRPPLFGRQSLVHRVFLRDRNTVDDILEALVLHASSHWDSLRHIRAREFGFFGGITEWDSPAAEDLGIHQWARTGIIGRGVLLDLPQYWASQGRDVDPLEERSIDVEELLAVARFQHVEFEPADLLLVRTGWIERYLSGDSLATLQDGELRSVGLAATEPMARFLWDQHFGAVISDNPAVEVSPGDPRVGFLHRRVLPTFGLALGELWYLADLAAACAELNRYAVCVFSIPLNLPGGVGSPANAIAAL